MGKSKTNEEIKAIYKFKYEYSCKPEFITVNGHKIDLEEYLSNPKKYNNLKPTKEALRQMKEYEF